MKRSPLRIYCTVRLVDLLLDFGLQRAYREAWHELSWTMIDEMAGEGGFAMIRLFDQLIK